MRISDWSSDVCSSDLRWRSADDRFDIDGWLVKPADYQPGKRYPLILDVHGGPGVAFRNSFDALHFEGAHQVPPELYLRSEEHTSELQSLMRISYAVFCLKKKKKQTNTQHITNLNS